MADTEKKTPVKKTVTRVENTTKAEAGREPTVAVKADPASAKPKRIVAWILWVLALGCEALAILVFVGKVDLHFCSQVAQLIGFLVLDFVLVVVGAQFWKKANHLDPVSKTSKFKFWLWNNMGVIVCCFCFIPFLIYVLLIDKNADPKLKKVASIAAAVALLLGIGLSYDWHPVSKEELTVAQETLDGVDVYWTKFGSVYHTDLECQHLNRSSEAFVGDVATAVANGKTRLCKTCAKNGGLETDDNGAITGISEELQEAVATLEEVPEGLDESSAGEVEEAAA